jgi:DNA-directed RNA polymerase specialized sigma24 family protein
LARFRELREHELQLLSDEQLLDYIQEARAAGIGEAVELAVAILVHGYLPNIERRVARKVPAEHVEQVADDVVESTLRSAFDGTSKGEFAKWVGTITSRRIADYCREKERKPETISLSSDYEGTAWDEALAVEFEGVAVDIERATQIAYGELNPGHQVVVDLVVFAAHSPAETAALTGDSANNVSQIGSRFRVRLRELLDDDEIAS